MTTLAIEYANLTDYLTHAAPGDRFTEHRDRSITTHVFIERDTHPDADEEGGTVHSIVTHHYGKAEYVGPPEYCFQSYVQTLPMSAKPLEAGRSVITRAYAPQHPATGLGRIEAKRFSAKRLQEAHAAALDVYASHADQID